MKPISRLRRVRQLLSVSIIISLLGSVAVGCQISSKSPASPPAGDGPSSEASSGRPETVPDLEPMVLKDEEWDYKGGDMYIEDNKMHVMYQSELWFRPYEATGAYTIQFTVQCIKKQGVPSIGAIMEGGRTAKEQLYFLMNEKDSATLSSAERYLEMTFPRFNLSTNKVKCRLDVFPEQKNIVYYINGKMAGEFVMKDPSHAPLAGGKVGMRTAGCEETVFEDIHIGDIEEQPEPIVFDKPIIKADLDKENLFPRAAKKPAEEIFVFNPWQLTNDQQLTLVTLQGLVNRDEPRLFVNYDKYNADKGLPDNDLSTLDILREKGRTVTPVDNLYDLLEKFSDCYDGIILGNAFDIKTVAYEPNIVTTLAGIRDAVYMSSKTHSKMEGRVNKEVVFNTRDKWSSAMDAYKWAWDTLWPECNQNIIAHTDGEGTYHYTMPFRDYLVQNKIFCFYSAGVVTREDYYFYYNMLASTPVNTPVIGIASRNSEVSVTGVLDENALFRACGELGKYFVYTFSVPNMSLTSSLETDGPLKQKEIPVPKPDNSKVYTTLMMSDGDNFAWDMHLWDAVYKRPDRSRVSKGWSMSGALYWLAPAVLEHFYKNASPSDCFFLDGGGIGDLGNPDLYAIRYPEEYRDGILRQQLELVDYCMDKSDYSVLRIFSATKITDEAIEKYVKDIPHLKSVYTSYGVEPGGVSYDDANYLIGGVPVLRGQMDFHEGGDSGGKKFLSAWEALADKAKETPSFFHSFLYGNTVNTNFDNILYVEQNKKDNYEIVRPDVFAELVKQYSLKQR